jgi:hypothetical protein
MSPVDAWPAEWPGQERIPGERLPPHGGHPEGASD